MDSHHKINKYLLSDPEVLSLITRMQSPARFVSVSLILASLFISFVLHGQGWLQYLSNVLLLSGFILLVLNRAHFRFRQRIIRPQPGHFYSPVTGKLISIETQNRLIHIQKSRFDHVEIRCPADGSQWQEGSLIVPFQQDSIRIWFQAKKLIGIEAAEMKAGEVIALMIGSGSCVISMPQNMEIDVQIAEKVYAGESEILDSGLTDDNNPKEVE